MSPSINSTILDSPEIQRPCAGKKCRSQGTHYLEIKYLYKSGWFCDSCTEKLVTDGLLSELSDGTEARTQ